LHAARLGFKHPTTGKEMDFEAPLPNDMQLLIEKWRNYTANRITENDIADSHYEE
jgi:23S rRNA pseudouridine1911/1915/1917 synthase